MSIASDFFALGDTMVDAYEGRNRARKDIQAKVKKIQTEVKEMMYVFKDMVTDRKREVAEIKKKVIEMKKEVADMMNDIKNKIYEARAAWSNVMSKMSEVRSGI